jgi:glycosyltransferase A (GT-A) superfamily protein (DUF2064 family)
MAIRKHALLLFAKPPVPGFVKTRLTRERGGAFSQEEAAEIFRRSMFDVTELCCLALNDLEVENAADRLVDPGTNEHSYSFFISTTPAENAEVMRRAFEEVGEWPREFTYIVDEGSTFDRHFDNAFQQIFDAGFDSILSIGADIPLLPREHITNGFRWLHYFLETSDKGGVIQAPCQEVGVSLIGWTRGTDISHEGVYYNMNGRSALDAYLEKTEEKEIPLVSMMPVADIDDMSDFAHAVSLARILKYSKRFQPNLDVPERFLAWANWRGIKVGTPPNKDYDSREGIDV